MDLSALFAAIRSGSRTAIEGYPLQLEQETADSPKVIDTQQAPLMKWVVSEGMLRKKHPGHTASVARPEGQEEATTIPSSVTAPSSKVRGNFKRFKKAQIRSGSLNIISIDRMKAFIVDPTTATEYSSPPNSSYTGVSSEACTERETRSGEASWLSPAPSVPRHVAVRHDENFRPENEAPTVEPPQLLDKTDTSKPVKSTTVFKSNLFNSIRK